MDREGGLYMGYDLTNIIFAILVSPKLIVLVSQYGFASCMKRPRI